MGNKSSKKQKIHFNVLVCGQAQSGKSTFFKQIKKIHNEEIVDDTTYAVLRANIIIGLSELVTITQKFKNTPSSNRLPKINARHVELGTEMPPSKALECLENLTFGSVFDDNVINSLNRIWNAGAIRRAWSRRHGSNQISISNLDYCMSNLKRIANEKTPATQEDALMMRRRTTGQSQYIFRNENKKNIRMIDVGGQRTERRRWNHVMATPDVVLFFASLSDFNLTSSSPSGITRLQESLDIWKDIITWEEYENSTFIVVLNKVDLFNDKITIYDFKKYFPDYTGRLDSANETTTYIKNKFREIFSDKKPSSDKVGVHITCILKEHHVKRIFTSFSECLYKRMLVRGNLL